VAFIIEKGAVGRRQDFGMNSTEFFLFLEKGIQAGDASEITQRQAVQKGMDFLVDFTQTGGIRFYRRCRVGHADLVGVDAGGKGPECGDSGLFPIPARTKQPFIVSTNGCTLFFFFGRGERI
jgi:hypothetical protein